jgi:hypothetical protein
MNMKKVPWVRLAVQVIALASIVPYMIVIEKFRQVIEGMKNIELPALAAFIFYSPGLYLYPAAVICAFALFLWSWKTDRLKNKFMALLYNWPLLPVLGFVWYLIWDLFWRGRF